jgi:GSCFA family
VKPFEEKISLRDPILLTGSCFTEHMAAQLRNHRFRVLENPSGILFNPSSIARSLTSCIEGRRYGREDLFETDGVWHSWDFHSRFSSTDPDHSLELMNRSHAEAHGFLKEAKWIIITLGSAYVYQHPDGNVVANCHKVPADRFRKRLLNQEELLKEMDNLIHRLFLFNPSLRIIFTVSPVRHLREGYVENNRSKAALLSTVHHLVDKFDRLYYFPAYELVIDDLRDYRFFAEDMAHPNYMATRYVWEQFVPALIDPSSRQVMLDVNELNAAKAHRALQPDSSAHARFLRTNLDKALALQGKYPWLDFSDDIRHFSAPGRP